MKRFLLVVLAALLVTGCIGGNEVTVDYTIPSGATRDSIASDVANVIINAYNNDPYADYYVVNVYKGGTQMGVLSVPGPALAAAGYGEITQANLEMQMFFELLSTASPASTTPSTSGYGSGQDTTQSTSGPAGGNACMNEWYAYNTAYGKYLEKVNGGYNSDAEWEAMDAAETAYYECAGI